MASRDTLFAPWLKYLIRARAHGTLEVRVKQIRLTTFAVLVRKHEYVCVCIDLFPAVRAASLSSPGWGSDVSLRIL